MTVVAIDPYVAHSLRGVENAYDMTRNTVRDLFDYLDNLNRDLTREEDELLADLQFALKALDFFERFVGDHIEGVK